MATLERLFSRTVYKLSLDMLPCSFKDLEWHKGKKHRHRRRLSLLLRDLLVTKPVAIFSTESGERLLKHGVLCRSARAAPFLLHAWMNSAAVTLPIEMVGGCAKSLISRRRIA